MNAKDFAFAALEKGIQCIPLNENKVPLFSFKDIEITEQFINLYFDYYEQAKVLGVLTRNVWCIDIDVDSEKNVSGFDSLKGMPFTDELMSNMNKTLVQSTPTGGAHYVFLKNEGVDYQQKINYLDHVDIKAHYNNYFVLAGSVTEKGIYTKNDLQPIHYKGAFEERIFGSKGSYSDQILEKYSVKNTMPEYYGTELPPGKGGRGKDAYERIIKGQSQFRNNDLFLAATYAKQCNIDLEPLRILIGTVNNNGDTFTESEWVATVQSAN